MARAGGLSQERLGRLARAMRAAVARREVHGFITLVARRDDLFVDCDGLQAVETGPPMRRDTLLRIASMTKPITAVAALILLEEGRLRLDDPVDPWLPELANRKVLRSLDGPMDDVVAAQRPITLRDLLTFRLGFGMISGIPGPLPIQRAMAKAEITMGVPPHPQLTPDQWMERLGRLPLMHQPGKQWMYHTGSEVLGVLIARVAGVPFADFLEERIFAPLGMRDTGFVVPEAKASRLAHAYAPDPRTKDLALYDAGAGGHWTKPPPYPSGGGGLVSTVDDYLAFARMLLDGGRHGSTRILSRPSVELMTSDQLTLEQKAASPFTPRFWDDRGWGFGVSVCTKRGSIAASPGRYGWDGAFGTSWSNDPREELIAILMVQRLGNPLAFSLIDDFWTLVYQSIDD